VWIGNFADIVLALSFLGNCKIMSYAVSQRRR
jgi:hypothetical protein